MDNNFDNLNRLLESIKTANLLTRIFSWAKIKNQLVDAMGDLQRLLTIAEVNKETIAKLESAAASSVKDLQIANDSINKKETEIEKMQASQQETGMKLERLTSENGALLTTVKSNGDRIYSLTSDNRLLNEKSTQLTAENKNLSEQAAKNSQTINDLANRKAELDIELAENKKDVQVIQQNFQETSEKLTLLIEENASVLATAESHKERLGILTSDNKVLTEKNSLLTGENKRLAEDAATNTQNLSELTKRKAELDVELGEFKKELQLTQTDLNDVKKLNTQLLKDDEFRKQEQSSSLSTLTKLQEQVRSDRAKELDERNEQEIEKLKRLKETWSRHEENVNNILKGICQKNTIEYISRVPFKGNPDNTLKICDEFVVFDAKSPGGDTLHNFPGYLGLQAEKANKYAKQENVKKDIFFVVPSNTLEYLKTFVYRYGDHNVYIISIDALEPVILSLKKIEEYEFVDQLSPEDRENICRVLGRFAHLSKRRIQVDSFFAKQFIELAYKCETLPPDILKTVIEFEKSEKLNPPMEKRAKAIPLAEVETESKNVNSEADGRGILIQNDAMSELLNELPLYKQSPE